MPPPSTTCACHFLMSLHTRINLSRTSLSTIHNFWGQNINNSPTKYLLFLSIYTRHMFCKQRWFHDFWMSFLDVTGQQKGSMCKLFAALVPAKTKIKWKQCPSINHRLVDWFDFWLDSTTSPLSLSRHNNFVTLFEGVRKEIYSYLPIHNYVPRMSSSSLCHPDLLSFQASIKIMVKSRVGAYSDHSRHSSWPHLHLHSIQIKPSVILLQFILNNINW